MDKKLSQSMGFWQALALVFTLVVGSGFFGLPGVVLEKCGLQSSIMGWIVTIVVMFPMIIVFSELGAKFRSAGGLSTYAQNALGDWGEDAVVFVIVGSVIVGVPALALTGGAYAAKLFDLGNNYEYLFAVLFLVFTTGINLAGVKVSNTVNLVSTLLILFVAILLVIFNTNYFITGLNVTLNTLKNPTSVSYSSVHLCSLILFWAFIGWEELSFGLEEIKNPVKNIPRVHYVSFVLISIIYLLLAVTTFGATTAGIAVVGKDGLSMLSGSTGGYKLAITVITVLIISNLNSNIFAYSRFVFSGARSLILPSGLAKLSKQKIPFMSIAANGLFYCIAIFMIYFFKLEFHKIVVVVDQNFAVLYAITLLAYFRHFKGLRAKVILILAVCSCGYFFSDLNWWLLYPVLLIALGWISHKRRSRRSEANEVTSS